MKRHTKLDVSNPEIETPCYLINLDSPASTGIFINVTSCFSPIKFRIHLCVFSCKSFGLILPVTCPDA